MSRLLHMVPKAADRWVQAEARLYAGLLQQWGYETASANDDAEGISRVSDLTARELLLLHLTRECSLADLPVPAARTIIVLHSLEHEEDLHLVSAPYRDRFQAALQTAERLVPAAELCIAHCNAGAARLEALGARRVRQLPYLFDEAFFAQPAQPFAQAFATSGFHCLFSCGDLLPRSGSVDLLLSFWFFQQFENRTGSSWRLLLAGGLERCDGCILPFSDAMREYRIPQEQVLIDGGLSDGELRAWYAAAEAYLHFDAGDLCGAPLIAAVHSGIPVIGAAVGAAADILGDSALLRDGVMHSACAESIGHLFGDPAWRQRVVTAQTARLELLKPEAIAFTLRSLFSRFE